MPTGEMITVDLVQAYIARGVLVSLLCQSKNSEELNTFHPNSGGGLTVPLENVWRNTWSVNSSGWLYCKSLCVQGGYRQASRTKRQGSGALGIIYAGSRRDRGIGGRGREM